jgi:hypothetical protein
MNCNNDQHDYIMGSFMICTPHQIGPLLEQVGTAIPVQGNYRPRGFQRGSHISRQSAHEGGWALSPMHQPFCSRLSRPQGHSAAGGIKSMKHPNEPIGTRTRDLPTCSTVAQPPAPRRAPIKYYQDDQIKKNEMDGTCGTY